jgi:hypothetical protein
MELNNGSLPRVLICAPVSSRHSFVFFDWISQLNKLTYPSFDVCVVDNTVDNGEYYDKIKDVTVKGNKIISWRSVWEPSKEHSLQMLARIREEQRQYFLKNDYDYLMWLDDDIFLPENGIQRLLSYNKDNVGFVVHIFPEGIQCPCLLKSGEIIMGKGLPFYSFEELKYYKKYVESFRNKTLTEQEKHLFPFIIKDEHRPQLLKAYGVNLGCLLVRKNVVEAVPFRSHPTFIMGEDIWYFAEANDKHFEFWCDTDIRCEHRNSSWTEVEQLNTHKFKMHVIHGDTSAKEAVRIDYGK